VSDLLQSFLDATWLNAIIMLLLNVLVAVFSVLLLPLNLLISLFIPDFSQYSQAVVDFFELAATHLGWLFSAFAVPAAVLTVVALYYVFTISVSATAWGAKLILKWIAVFR